MKPEQARKDSPVVQMEKVYPHSPERVWQALTDPKALVQWLLPTTFKPIVGHGFRFTRLSKEGKRRKVRCQVVELEAPRRLAYTWQAEDEDAPSLVTWTLEPVEDGTRLRLEHTGLETSCAYESGSVEASVNGLPVNALAERLAAFLVSSVMNAERQMWPRQRSLSISQRIQSVQSEAQTKRVRVGRIVLQTSAQPMRCVSRRVTQSH